MADHDSLRDDEILAGSTSLQQAIAVGFERHSADLRSLIHSEIALVRSDVGALEHRMLRRFDAIDTRFDRLEERVGKVGERVSKLDERVSELGERTR